MLLAAAQPRTDSGGLITDGEGDARSGHGPFIGSGLSFLVSRLSSLFWGLRALSLDMEGGGTSVAGSGWLVISNKNTMAA
jgi:hypothetical protein